MARGRLLNRSVSASLKFHLLPDDTCRLLATWTIAHLDMNGVFYGDTVMIKSFVFPRRGDISLERVESYLQAMEEQGLIYRYEADGDIWQCWPGFADNQPNLRRDRERPEYPLPPAITTQECPPIDGNVTAVCRQDAAKIPAEEKLIKENIIEDAANAEPKTPAEKPKQEQKPKMSDISMTTGLEFYLTSFNRKRFANYAQKKALADCEREVSTEIFRQAVHWAALKNIRDANAIITAAHKFANNNGRAPPGATGPPKNPVVVGVPQGAPKWMDV